MKILLDENIPGAGHYLAGLGELERLPGSEINPRQLAGVDVLLVRSVTRVDQALLAGSPVRFVGSCTAGLDHVDQAWLARSGIHFAHAPGANAPSVVEYVVSALAALAERGKGIGPGNSVGIIGLGNVGGRLYRVLDRLGFDCLGYDPLLPDRGDYRRAANLEETLCQDIVSLHVPLTGQGSYPTHHLLAEDALRQLDSGAVLINTSRGAVVDNGALLRVLAARDDLSTVWDVWEGEPALDPALLQRVDLATPHIAGYSDDGKLRGTEMVSRQLCAWLGQEPRPSLLPAPVEKNGSGDWRATAKSILKCYDIRDDDRAMRQALGDCSDLPRKFEELRRSYPGRRELGLVREISQV